MNDWILIILLCLILILNNKRFVIKNKKKRAERFKFVCDNYTEGCRPNGMRATIKIGADIVEFGFYSNRPTSGWVHMNGELIQHKMHHQDVIQAIIWIAKANKLDTYVVPYSGSRADAALKMIANDS